MEWLIIIGGGLLLFLDDYFNFIPHSILPFILFALGYALVKSLVKDAVKEAIEESKND